MKDQVSLAMQEVLDTTTYINGPQVQSFQKNMEAYLDCKHVIPCANGTDALQIAMMGLGLKPGDEVITADFTFAATVEVIVPDLTFAASANVVIHLGATPVLVDVEPDTFNISVDAIRKAITPKTRAIVPVHLFGQVANMQAIMEIANEYNLLVIDDNAQAI
ncbi:MAG TPA: aminotransferase class I/II-fold pyridoxal phosphate-dependent enzyme, partial [Flavobacterium sp.]|nr:aminotransferase class I/II-fold pyridoxal phosphate-dependent enzyme [Flavobacterium sp.]